jgi:hypothetical protein
MEHIGRLTVPGAYLVEFLPFREPDSLVLHRNF